MKQNRSAGRGMKLSKERIEKDLVKLKRRMNQLYVEVMARERALEFFAVRTDERTLEEAVSQEEQALRTEAIRQIEEQTNKNLPEIDVRVQAPEVLEEIRNDDTLGEVK